MRLKVIVAALLLPTCAWANLTSTTDKTGPVTITGLPQTLAVGFPFSATPSDLLVLDEGSVATPRDPATVLAINSDYTVAGGGWNSQNSMLTGSITVVGTGANSVLTNDQIVIMRGVPINQPTAFTPSGPNTILLLEQALDRLATLSQQVNEIGSRSLQFENFEFLNPTLGLALRKSMLLGFDASGNVAFYPIGGSGQPGTVTNIATGAGLTGGPITTSGTISQDFTYGGSYTGANTFHNITIAMEGFNMNTETALFNDITNHNEYALGSGPNVVASGIRNFGAGYNVLTNLTTGNNNTAVGNFSLVANLVGSNNTILGSSADTNGTANNITAIGTGAAQSMTSGSEDTAIGSNALNTNVTGTENTAVGYSALSFYTGLRETAVGARALQNNTTGTFDTAVGWSALILNTTGFDNTAVGYEAIAGVQNTATTGHDNTGVGFEDASEITTGSDNTAIGSFTLAYSTTANSNNAVGFEAMELSVAPAFSVAVGNMALQQDLNSNGNTAVGYESLQGIDPTTGTITNISATGGTITVLGTNTFSGGNAVTITGTQNWNGNYTIATASGSQFTITSAYTAQAENAGFFGPGTGPAPNNTAIGYESGFNGSTSLTGMVDCTFLGATTTANAAAYTDSTAVGYGASITASNQMVYGDTNVTSNVFHGSAVVPGTLTVGGGSVTHNFNNFATAGQTPAATTRTVITGSHLHFAAGAIQVGTIIHWVFDMTKTSAGSASSTFDIAFGTAGTTSDTARVSFTKPAGTAAADEATVTVEAVVKTNSASGVVLGNFALIHNLASTGHATIPCVSVETTSGTFDTTAPTDIELCITSGASDAITINQCTVYALNL